MRGASGRPRRWPWRRPLVPALVLLASVALALSGLVTASLWLFTDVVRQASTARERDQFFLYQARVEQLQLAQAALRHANGELAAQELDVRLEVFLGRVDALRSAPVLEPLRQDARIAREIERLVQVTQAIDQRRATQDMAWLRARIDEAGDPLRELAQVALAATVASQQRSYEGLIGDLRTSAYVLLGIVLAMLALAVLAGVQTRRIWKQVDEERRLAGRLRLQATAIESAANAIFVTDRTGRILWVNAAFERLSGYRSAEVVGRSPSVLVQGVHDPSTPADLWERVLAGEIWRGVSVNRRRSGELYQVDQTITPVRSESGEVDQVVTVQDDITEQVAAQERLHYLARHDLVTNLPNRSAFLERAAEAIARAQRQAAYVAIMLMDLDRFKEVNDTLGHATGDALLRAVGERLGQSLRDSDMLARLGGDEFALVLEGLESPAQAALAADRFTSSLSQPFLIEAHSLQVSASLGVACFPGDGHLSEELLRRADLAMYAAKASSQGRYRFFEPAMDSDLRERVELAAELRKAQVEGLWVAFQLQFDLRSGDIVGAEALMRWTHPDRGVIGPDRFIPVAELSGAILELGYWMVRQVGDAHRRLEADGVTVPRVAVNLSAVQFEQEDFVDRLLALLREQQLEPARVELELTEGVLMGRSPRVEDNLRRLEEQGFQFAVDDFGTGYSSLEYLRRFPVHRLKIDASFVHGIGRNPDDESIVGAVIDLGHSLGLTVLAEGVETQEQRDFLLRRGCDQAQGFLFARPQPLDDLSQILRRRLGAPA